MDMPTYQELMKPVLEFYSDRQAHARRDTIQTIVDSLHLSPEALARTTTRGQLLIHGRIGWAHTYLRQAGLLERVSRGVYKITDRGLTALSENLPEITNEYLAQFDSFRQFITPKEKIDSQTIDTGKEGGLTPEERIKAALNEHDSELKSELLEALRGVEPFYFETIVAQLLQKMGYGEAHVTQRTNDGGIDAIVDEDKLGLSKIYAQAKRYGADNRVNRKELQNFVGALTIHNISKGVFITTSHFYNDATEDVRHTQKSIVLVDGDRLAELMITYGLGVTAEQTYTLSRVDNDYFEVE